MDQNNFNPQTKSITQKVQGFIDAGLWEKITREIGQKYSLDNDQTESLVDDTLLLITGDSNAELFIGYVKEDLSVSDVIAEQILDELDRRVFAPNIDIVTQEKKIDPISRSPIAKVIIPEKSPELGPMTTPFQPTGKRGGPETPPNLPVSDEDKEIMGQKVDIPRYIPTKIENIKDVEAKKYESLKEETASQMYAAPEVNSGFNSPIGSRINYKPAASPLTKPNETIQRSFQVPRINLSEGGEVEVEKPTPTQTTPTQEAVVTVTDTLAPPVARPGTTNPIVKSYSVDPYREPVE